MDDMIVQKAKDVVRHFRIENYIDRHDFTIYKKLITLYLEGAAGREFDSLIFISNSLEVSGHIIHLGTSRRTYLDGIHWIRGAYPDATPRNVSAALVLIYIIASAETDKGKKALIQAENDVNETFENEKRIDAKDVWDRIRQIVEGALSPNPVR